MLLAQEAWEEGWEPAVVMLGYTPGTRLCLHFEIGHSSFPLDQHGGAWDSGASFVSFADFFQRLV